MKIQKEQFEKLFNENISKKEYDQIISLIDSRCDEIVNKMQTSKSPQFWWDFGNLDHEAGEGNGYFDPEEYKTFIEISGEYLRMPEPFSDGFPTRWLWEDFEEEFTSKVKKYKAQEELKKEQVKSKRVALQVKKEIIFKSIRSKLTKEELKFIKLK